MLFALKHSNPGNIKSKYEFCISYGLSKIRNSLSTGIHDLTKEIKHKIVSVQIYVINFY